MKYLVSAYDSEDMGALPIEEFVVEAANEDEARAIARKRYPQEAVSFHISEEE